MAILLDEAGLLPRCRIYATDLSEKVLAKAKKCIFPLSVMQEYTRNYQEAGGQRDFSDYYSADHSFAIFKPSLRDSMVFAQHNLVTDGSFNSFHVVLCRNVMIYFSRKLQDKVHGLLYNSLEMFGVLAVGLKESLRFTPHETSYECMDEPNRLYRRVG